MKRTLFSFSIIYQKSLIFNEALESSADTVRYRLRGRKKVLVVPQFLGVKRGLVPLSVLSLEPKNDRVSSAVVLEWPGTN